LDKVPLFVPPGHFYSPIVVPADVEALVLAARISPPETLPDVRLDLARMENLWADLLPTLRTTAFPHDPHPGKRYHWNNGQFGYGDAMMLRAMIMRQKPRRFIEIGSGFSSAVVLDTLDEMGGPVTAVTFIEPYPKTLRSLLQPGDPACVQILEQRVQDVPLPLFDDLDVSDILFIDSTHVLKTGSDVVHELGNVLPRLRSGVVIHFHDVFYPFEYPYSWAVQENRSWNELYALRSFLAYNDRFEVVFFNDYFFQMRQEAIASTAEDFLRNAGGSLWLRKL
jgi:predicted O-methyltransferase YrrM